MNAFGKKLKEAREQRGLSVQDVSEAIKITEAALLKIEENKLDDIDLPVIYVRGFVRNYARFLHLNDDEMIVELDKIKQEEALHSKPAQRESLGHIDVAEVMPTPPSMPPKTSEQVKREKTVEPESDEEKGRLMVYKTGIILGGAIISVILLVVLIKALSSGGASDNISKMQTNAPDASIEAIENERLSFIATGDVFLQVTQLPGDQSLYKGALVNGDRIELIKNGEVRVEFSEGRNLIIQQGDQQSKIAREGKGWTLIQ